MVALGIVIGPHALDLHLLIYDFIFKITNSLKET